MQMDGKARTINEEDLTLAQQMLMPLSLLQDITNNFSDDQKIGEGGFSIVYMGLLNEEPVAVKKPKKLRIDDNGEAFVREVRCLQKLNPHENIVQFRGYCDEVQNIFIPMKDTAVLTEHETRLLCFAYHRDSLDRQISDESSGLGWMWRYKIIKGICKGLHHIHEKDIAHLDLKPENILLDSNMVPKISDFGNSRRFKGENQLSVKNVVGTNGYIAPEIIDKMIITKKSDIYSLGIVILEILRGRRQQERSVCVPTDVYESWKKRLMTSRGDTCFLFPKETGDQLLEHENMRKTLLDQVRVCAEICVQCLDTDPDKRPTIQGILHELGQTESTDGFTETIKVPMQNIPKWRPVTPLVPQSIHSFPSMNAAFCYAQVAEGVDKIGPFGGGGGKHYDTIKIPHCLKSITVRNGLIVDSIQFSYQDREKTLDTPDRWGGPGGFEQVTIELDEDTCLKRMSGTYAPFNDETVVITSLTFVTSNNVKYGPLGSGGGTTFDIHLSEGSIVGFFVRAGWFIDAIGVYVRR